MSDRTTFLTNQLVDWVERQAHTGQYADASEYIRDLIRQDQARAAKIIRMQEFVS